MDTRAFSTPVNLRNISVDDAFWKLKMELVRTEVIPYQWEAINDRVPGASPSYCMRNYKVAGRINEMIKAGTYTEEPSDYFRGFEILPEDREHPDDDKFYGFVFQDTDFSKWLEAVGYSLTQHPDPELERTADEAIDIVCAAQQEDGYLDTYYIISGRSKAFSNLKDHHELYCLGHLIEGAVAYYEATGKDKILNAARRYADCVAEKFGPKPNQLKGYPGHEIAEMALVRLYKVTGDKKYLDLAEYFINQRGQRPYYFDSEISNDAGDCPDDEERYVYYQAHRPVREQDEAVGHAVRAVYLYSGMADIAREIGDDELFAACRRLWDSITKEKMYITGGIGATHLGEAFSFPFDLPNDTAYAETCASIGLVFFARRMLEICPDSRYADIMERALYNGVLSGMALDGKSFFYVNPLEADPVASLRDERKFHVKTVRQKWFGCACCPPNIARLISSIGSYAYTQNDDTLFVHLYMGAKLSLQKGNDTTELSIKSDMPWEGRAKISVSNAAKDFRLALRIPEWAAEYTVDGTNNLNTRVRDGYMYISAQNGDGWPGEVSIELVFKMECALMVSDPRVKENAGLAALQRGPVVYCLEEKDNGPMLHLLKIDPNTKFNVYDGDICGEKVKLIEAEGYGYKEKTKLKFIPYYTWANRGDNEMRVYVRL